MTSLAPGLLYFMSSVFHDNYRNSNENNLRLIAFLELFY